MFCQNCGKENLEGTQFCTICGSKIGDDINTSVLQSTTKKNVWIYFTDTIIKFYRLTTDGRAGRLEYWGFVLFYLIFAFAAGVVNSLVFGESYSTIIVDYYIGIFMLPYFSVAFRRMHDVGKPAGFIFIPVYGFILSLLDSEKGINKYGSSPKEN